MLRSQGRFAFASALHHAAFAEAFRATCGVENLLKADVPETFLIPKDGGGPPYCVELHALRDAAHETDIPGRFALILVTDPGRTAALSLDGIAALGGLTPAETAICEGLLAGQTPRDIARVRGASVETVRKQIQSAQGKFCCRSRSDLLQIAMATILPILR